TAWTRGRSARQPENSRSFLGAPHDPGSDSATGDLVVPDGRRVLLVVHDHGRGTVLVLQEQVDLVRREGLERLFEVFRKIRGLVAVLAVGDTAGNTEHRPQYLL